MKIKIIKYGLIIIVIVFFYFHFVKILLMMKLGEDTCTYWSKESYI